MIVLVEYNIKGISEEIKRRQKLQESRSTRRQKLGRSRKNPATTLHRELGRSCKKCRDDTTAETEVEAFCKIANIDDPSSVRFIPTGAGIMTDKIGDTPQGKTILFWCNKVNAAAGEPDNLGIMLWLASEKYKDRALVAEVLQEIMRVVDASFRLVRPGYGPCISLSGDEAILWVYDAGNVREVRELAALHREIPEII